MVAFDRWQRLVPSWCTGMCGIGTSRCLSNLGSQKHASRRRHACSV